MDGKGLFGSERFQDPADLGSDIQEGCSMIKCDKVVNRVGGSLVIYITRELADLGLKKGDRVHVCLEEEEEKVAENGN